MAFDNKESKITSTSTINGTSGEEQVQEVVKRYIHAEFSGDWRMIGPFLSGEALGEARNNLTRKNVGRKLLTANVTDTQILSPVIAIVTADITSEIQDDPVYTDRFCIRYSLLKEAGSWLIYKAETVEMDRHYLSPGPLPVGASRILNEYFSMPYEQKKHQETKYLAGEALPALRTAAEGLYRRNLPEITSKGFEVIKIESLGVAEQYCIAKVIYRGGNQNFTDTAIVDMVNVAGQWKIIRFVIFKRDISEERGN
ncbi:hypothetical protein [Desulforamulus aquiferis]|uniref:SnoaL-like domain-containing protein n=1 Tax=Desulforamulus aquiferis TaxID=1397668 RepID=A0AAW7Z7U2_9FIRM|nr:hypothetical protein [Desulforamulus aquiferis]MDO7785810.1 hypothetical protein [Desulforamulus aquiferis]